jgi:tRNA-specific adenosine deaminase 1
MSGACVSFALRLGLESVCSINHSTGAQCLPARGLTDAHGNVLHDWHAEILAIRAFNYFVLQECHKLSVGHNSRYITLQAQVQGSSKLQPFLWCEEIKLHMYCSEAPCGSSIALMLLS